MLAARLLLRYDMVFESQDVASSAFFEAEVALLSLLWASSARVMSEDIVNALLPWQIPALAVVTSGRTPCKISENIGAPQEKNKYLFFFAIFLVNT